MNNRNSGPAVGVIGGGPAGLMAAGTAALAGASVVLFEKNASCGKKLLLSGAGKCNIANNAPLEEFLEQFPENGKFLYPVFKGFFTGELEEFFNQHHVFFHLEENGKYFPDTNKASSVLDALMSFCTENHVDLHLEEPVLDVSESGSPDNDAPAGTRKAGFLDGISGDNRLVPRWEIRTVTGTYFVDSVIIATGGLSYPRTGSSGDGYRIAANLSHSIVPTRPGLVPVEVAEPWCSRLSGIGLKDIAVTLWENGAVHSARRITAMSGDLLFTHFGLSGPVILFLSRWIREFPSGTGIHGIDPHSGVSGSGNPDNLVYSIVSPDTDSCPGSDSAKPDGHYFLTADLISSLSQVAAGSALLRAFADSPNKQLKTVLSQCFGIPHAVASVIVESCDMNEEAFCRDVTKERRKKLLDRLKAFHFTIVKTRGYNEAMVTAGGIETKEIHPRTMESTLHPGLYFAGEIIDIDGFTGGFNLQAAFSTGHLAGRSAAAPRRPL